MYYYNETSNSSVRRLSGDTEKWVRDHKEMKNLAILTSVVFFLFSCGSKTGKRDKDLELVLRRVVSEKTQGLSVKGNQFILADGRKFEFSKENLEDRPGKDIPQLKVWVLSGKKKYLLNSSEVENLAQEITRMRNDYLRSLRKEKKAALQRKDPVEINKGVGI